MANKSVFGVLSHRSESGPSAGVRQVGAPSELGVTAEESRMTNTRNSQHQEEHDSDVMTKENIMQHTLDDSQGLAHILSAP